MHIAYVAEAGIRDAVAAGLGGLDIETEAVDPASVTDDATVVAAGTPGGSTLSAVNRPGRGPWIAIEVGGIGGQSVVDIEGSIAILHGTGPCYACLRLRVTATAPQGDPTPTASPHIASYSGALAGWHLQSSADDGLADRVGTVYLLDGSTATVHPVPTCPICGDGVDRTDLTLTHPPDAGDDALARAESTVDPLVGIIAQVGEQSSYPLPYYVAQLAETEGFSDASAAQFAAGVDIDWDDAFMRALGEALERYCAGVYRLDDLPSNPESNAIPLDRFPLTQEDSTPIGRWYPGVDLHSMERVDLPVEQVVFPPPEEADVDSITTGLGLGNSPGEALLAGILEVIERDGCMLGWYSTFEAMELAVEHEAYVTLQRRMAGEGLATTSLLMTQDIDIPIVTSVVHRRDSGGDPVLDVPHTDPDDWPAFAVGSAAGFDPGVAAERALAEAIQNWTELEQMGQEQAKEEGNIGTFGSFPRAARPMLETTHTVDATAVGPDDDLDPAAALELALEHVNAVGLDAYAARVTTRDVAALGFEAVRVLIPEAQPLVKRRAHMTDRLRTVPRTLGFSPRLDRGPHPYP